MKNSQRNIKVKLPDGIIRERPEAEKLLITARERCLDTGNSGDIALRRADGSKLLE